MIRICMCLMYWYVFFCIGRYLTVLACICELTCSTNSMDIARLLVLTCIVFQYIVNCANTTIDANFANTTIHANTDPQGENQFAESSWYEAIWFYLKQLKRMNRPARVAEQNDA